MKNTKDNIAKITELLLNEYKDAKCALDYDTEFHLLVAVMLSAQTTDISVNKVTPILFKKARDPYEMSQMTISEIESYIKSLGLYKNKAKNISAMSKMLCEKYNGNVPNNFDELVSLPGVGRKTANVILSELYNIPTIAVDTHVFRLSNRIGLTEQSNVEKTEEELKETLNKEIWIKMHHALIWHGRRVCHSQNPSCNNCIINDYCIKKIDNIKKKY